MNFYSAGTHKNLINLKLIKKGQRKIRTHAIYKS